MFWTMGRGEPTRLFVGGLHGNEGIFTVKVLEEVSKLKVKDGSAVLYNLSETGKYVSTLNRAYYQTKIGKLLLSIIRRYKPKIYLEIHSYHPKNYLKLTDPFRRKRIGVPPFLELEDGVLVGSISPYLRISEFHKEDFCFTIEIPTKLKNMHVAIEFSRIVLNSVDRGEIIDALRKKYPEQIGKMEEFYREFYRTCKGYFF